MSTDRRPRPDYETAREQVVGALHSNDPDIEAVAESVDALFDLVLASAWEGGWQPADIDRSVRRPLDAAGRRLALDAIAGELLRAGRPAEVVAPGVGRSNSTRWGPGSGGTPSIPTSRSGRGVSGSGPIRP